MTWLEDVEVRVLVVDSIMEYRNFRSAASKVGRKILVDLDIDVKRLPRG